MDAYVNSELETEIVEDDDGEKHLAAGFQTEGVPEQAAKREFRNHLKAYLEGRADMEIRENWMRDPAGWEMTDYRLEESEKGLDKDIATYRKTWTGGKELELDFVVGYSLNNVRIRD